MNKIELCCIWHNEIYSKAHPRDDTSIVSDKLAFA